MAVRVFIKPGDISPYTTQLVLRKLNTIETPEELASLMDVSGDSDLGISIAKRIFERREQLGQFTNLQQVDDIPYIGPERFTDLVTILSRQEILGTTTDITVAGLLQEIQNLKARISYLEQQKTRGISIHIKTYPKQPYLGQPITITTMLRDPLTHKPQSQCPLTIQATWGILEQDFTTPGDIASAITGVTDINGTYTTILLPPTSEHIWETQRQALSAQLLKIPSAVPTPQDAASALATIADQYGWDINAPFRKAVDILFKDFGQGIQESINAYDYLHHWIIYPVTITVSMHQSTPSQQSEPFIVALGSATIRVKNWLGPWYQVFYERMRAQSTLVQDLINTAQATEDPEYFVSNMYKQMDTFLDQSRGTIGKRIQEKISGDTVSSFLDNHMDLIPAEQKESIINSLSTASKAIKTDGKDSFKIYVKPRLSASSRNDLTPKSVKGLVNAELSEKMDTEIEQRISQAVTTKFDQEMPAKVDQILLDKGYEPRNLG